MQVAGIIVIEIMQLFVHYHKTHGNAVTKTLPGLTGPNRYHAVPITFVPGHFQVSPNTMITHEKIKHILSREVIIELATPDMWEATLHPEEQFLIQRSVKKRKREFSAGRACARQALSQLGVTDFPLLPDKERVPIWPEGIIGSISHTQNCCIAIVAPKNRLKGIGVDIEQILDNTSEIQKLVCTRKEQDWLKTTDNKLLQWLTVIFSAKESVYKALYPSTRIPFDFADLHINIDTNTSDYAVEFLVGINPVPQITGKYLLAKNQVFTSCEYF